MNEKQRTLRQNKSLHKYCEEVSAEMNAHGIDAQAFVKSVTVDVTPEVVKSMWRSIAKAKYGKTSTAQLTTKELQEVFEEVNRHIAQFGVHIPWPSMEGKTLIESMS